MTTNDNVIHLDETNFDAEVLTSKQPVLVDFWAPWCGPCRMIAPAIDQLATEYAGRARVAKVNVDEAPTLAARFGVSSIPSLVYFQDGKIVDTTIGAAPKNLIAGTLDRLTGQA